MAYILLNADFNMFSYWNVFISIFIKIAWNLNLIILIFLTSVTQMAYIDRARNVETLNRQEIVENYCCNTYLNFIFW